MTSSKAEGLIGTHPQEVVSPFLKWAGGKRWFVEAFGELIPRNFKRYIEPFLGSGVLFFYLRPKKGILSDRNAELIETYKALRDDWRSVFKALRFHQQHHSEHYYYSVRRKNFRTPATRAARFIYLNKACWNGLYRVNREGQFNVPKGTRQNVLISAENLAAISERLACVDLRADDFRRVIAAAEKGDLLYVDPPYVTRRHNGSFIRYNEHLFSWADQVALRDALVAAKKRGVQILGTNANTKAIRRLYSDVFDLVTVSRKSLIAGSGENRGSISEVVIRG